MEEKRKNKSWVELKFVEWMDGKDRIELSDGDGATGNRLGLGLAAVLKLHVVQGQPHSYSRRLLYISIISIYYIYPLSIHIYYI